MIEGDRVQLHMPADVRMRSRFLGDEGFHPIPNGRRGTIARDLGGGFVAVKLDGRRYELVLPAAYLRPSS
jgi:hypothetical protein